LLYRGRVIQAQSDNYKDGIDIITNATTRVKTNYEFDHAGRLMQVYKTINDDLSKLLGQTHMKGINSGIEVWRPQNIWGIAYIKAFSIVKYDKSRIQRIKR